MPPLHLKVKNARLLAQRFTFDERDLIAVRRYAQIASLQALRRNPTATGNVKSMQRRADQLFPAFKSQANDVL